MWVFAAEEIRRIDLQLVQGTVDAFASLVQDMRVDHGRANVLVAKQFLNGTDVVTGLKQMSGEGMPQGISSLRVY